MFVMCIIQAGLLMTPLLAQSDGRGGLPSLASGRRDA